MTEDQILLVQKSWPQIANRLESIGEDFYTALFEKSPHLENLFTTGKKLQGEKFMQLLGLHITKLHLDGEPDEMMQSLGKRHVAYGVKNEHYPLFGDALIATLRKNLGPELWSQELEEAWKSAFNILGNLMQKGAKS